MSDVVDVLQFLFSLGEDYFFLTFTFMIAMAVILFIRDLVMKR